MTFVENFNMHCLKRCLPLVGILLCVTGCSVVGFGYSALPMYARYELHRHLDLDEEQGARVVQGLDELQSWHRAAELPVLVQTIADLRPKLARGLQTADVTQIRLSLIDRWQPIAHQLAGPSAQMALSLRKEQRDLLKLRMDQANAKTRKDFLQTDAEERIAGRIKRIRERAEFFYGDLNDAQQAQILSASKQSEFDSNAWYDERLKRQRRLHER